MGRNNGTLTGHRRSNPGEAFSIGEAETLRDNAAEEQAIECAAAAAITALARGYGAALAERVRDNRLPYGLEYYLEELGDKLSTQVKALGIPDYVPQRKGK